MHDTDDMSVSSNANQLDNRVAYLVNFTATNCYTTGMNPEQTEREQMRELMLENKRLLSENNMLLHKMYRTAWWSMMLRIFWFFVIIGAPFIVYYYIVEPYFTTLGSSFETFEAGLQEVPGWKQFYEAMGGEVSGGE